MNKDDVIRMATEAGLLEPGYIHGNTVIAELERFDALVAAAERRKHQADIEAWKAQAAMAEKWRRMAHARHGDGQKVVQEIQREAAAYERQKRQEAELMAECMDMVRQDLIDAGIIDKSVPPMMVPEAVASAINSRVSAEREACAQLCEQSDCVNSGYFAQKIRERGE